MCVFYRNLVATALALQRKVHYYSTSLAVVALYLHDCIAAAVVRRCSYFWAHRAAGAVVASAAGTNSTPLLMIEAR